MPTTPVPDNTWALIATRIAHSLGQRFSPGRPTPVMGGCTSAAWRLADGDLAVFIKTGMAEQRTLFEAEADGLDALAAGAAVRYPRVIAVGDAEAHSFLALEWLTIRGRGDWALLGRQLAAQHRNVSSSHGWHRDNNIGNTPQRNRRDTVWWRFFADNRLHCQLELAARRGADQHLIDSGNRLLERLPTLLGAHTPDPALLHGDLWSGNVGFCSDGQPVLFDPAVHHGDRECDLAMAALFGGFPDTFHHAYHAAWPLPPGWEQRRPLYQLYHVLNHGNLFGGSDDTQAIRIIKHLLNREA